MNNSSAIRPAATILLVRDGAEGLEVFMVVRHHQIDFASGALVFPGGSVEPDDHIIADDVDISGPNAGNDPIIRALRVAAVRETFEECGVFLGCDRGADTLITGQRSAALVKTATEKAAGDEKGGVLPFLSLLRQEHLSLALDRLVPFAHWVTPPIMPKRFDTHFYIAEAPADQRAIHDGMESVDSIWINPARALEKAEAGHYTIIFPTRLNLQLLAQHNTVHEALDAARNRKIITVEPILVKTETGRALKIPLEAGYGGEIFPM